MSTTDRLPTATAHFSLLADRRDAGDRIHAVLAWTDDGDRYYRPLATPVTTLPGAAGLQVAGMRATDPWSSGRSWRTWTLESVPAQVRGLPPAAAADVLAALLEEC